MAKSAAPRMLNVKLLRKIQKHIVEEPRRYNQDVWIEKDSAYIREVNGSVPACGTMACIGGWAQLLSKRHSTTEALGIDGQQASRLFDVVNGYSKWPKKFVARYLAAKTPAGRARVAVNRIDHFIKTKGAE